MYYDKLDGADKHFGDTKDDDVRKTMMEYRLYNELLPFVPNLKNIDKTAVSMSGSTPASSEVLGHGGSSNGTGYIQQMKDASSSQTKANSTFSGPDSRFGSYSTMLSVTIAVGCSLLMLNVLIFTACYYRQGRHRRGSGRRDSKLDSHSISSTMGPCKMQHDSMHHQQQQMHSISQYIERRPSDTDCLQSLHSDPSPTCETFSMTSNPPGTSRRNLPEMGLPTTTITVGGIPPVPRKSAMKQCSGNIKHKNSNSTSSFHAHLPPPEFADLPSPPPSLADHNRSSSNELMGIAPSDHQPLLLRGQGGSGDSSSFRTLPFRNPGQQQVMGHSTVGHGVSGTTSNPPHHQTLPLKSNLKKLGSCSNAGSGQKLQWNQPTAIATRSSLEELRV